MRVIFLLLLCGPIDESAAESVRVVIPGERQIVHVLDWHYVDKATFGECHRIEGEELDRRHAQMLKEVAAVHASQLEILAPVKEVFSEGLTDENLPTYRAALRGTVAYHRELKKLSADDGPTTATLLAEHQVTLFKFGAVGELSLDGKLTELAAEGPEFKAARPMGGTVAPELELAREEAIVRRLVKHGKTCVVVLGGGHDLAPIIRKHDGWGYVRVMPRGYPAD